MVQDLALVGYLAPLSLLAVALLTKLELLRSVELTFQFGRTAALGSFVLALYLSFLVFASGPLVSPVLGFAGSGVSLRLDELSVLIFSLVTFLATLLTQFSRNYLDGDPRQIVFFRRLFMTVAAVLLMILAGNLVQLVLGWIAMSLALHRLLLFYPERPRAVRAARKKFIVARLGDVCFVIAALLLVRTFATTDLVALHESFRMVRQSSSIPAGAAAAALLVALAAALKSAMFPFHGWLLEVMETPTPVSALLHAGLLNAGIFVIVRLGELIFLSTPALIFLIAIGGFTAIFASSAMITQSSVKVSLGYSSAAHMAFMLMLCGFGAHSVAIMHLIAHSCYKAHAFLSSGSAIEYAQNTGTQKLTSVPSPLGLLLNLAAALGMFLGVATLLGIDVTKRPGETAMITIFMITVAYLLVKGTTATRSTLVIARTALMAVLVTIAFFSLELTAVTLLGNAVAVFPQPDTPTLVAIWVAVFAFAGTTLFSILLPTLADRPFWRALYVHLKHGLYANDLFDRIVQPLRITR